MALRDFMAAQEDVRVLSVARNGFMKIAYDAERVSVDKATDNMRKCGVGNFDVSLDCRSGCVFVTIKSEKK